MNTKKKWSCLNWFLKLSNLKISLEQMNFIEIAYIINYHQDCLTIKIFFKKNKLKLLYE